MTSPSKKMAESLKILKKLQDNDVIAIQSKDLTRTHRERLIKNGFLKEITKGWYIPSRQNEQPGESTAWYASFWSFCSVYLNKRFGNEWCLSPEQSLSLYAGNWTVPKQLLVRSPKGNNKITLLPHSTSLLDARYTMPEKNQVTELNRLRLFSLSSALTHCSPRFFTQHPIDARTTLTLIRDASEILDILLTKGHSKIAGRLAGAFRTIGQPLIADEIIKTMIAAGYDVRETNPFEEILHPNFSTKALSPYVNRMYIMWQEMREIVIKHFPPPPSKLISIPTYLKNVENTYIMDAYHSLSIEGYRVSAELIQRVSDGKWDPAHHEMDKQHVAALAARGYWEAFKLVEKSIANVLKRKNPGTIFNDDHRDWYRAMFLPSVNAGILKPADLAGYRREAVYIRGSMHIPPNPNAVRDLMPAFCDLLTKETSAAARVVLGHFFFVYIHPYTDGNGRVGRFLMNVMLASGGYPWIIIHVEQRSAYINALEKASTQQNIRPFTDFIATLLAKKRGGKGSVIC